MNAEEIDIFLNEKRKKFKNKNKLLPFFDEIKYMVEKKTPQVIIKIFLLEKRNLEVSNNSLSLFIKKHFNEPKEKKTPKISKAKITKKTNSETSSKELSMEELNKMFEDLRPSRINNKE